MVDERVLLLWPRRSSVRYAAPGGVCPETKPSACTHAGALCPIHVGAQGHGCGRGRGRGSSLRVLFLEDTQQHGTVPARLKVHSR